MSLISMTRVFTLAISWIVLLGASAEADDFSFSFTETLGSFGTVSGTVTVEILGLTDNATSAAAEVIIESFPSGLDSLLGPAPIDALIWSNEIKNEFTERHGQVIAGTFWAYNINQIDDERTPQINEALEINAPYDLLSLNAGADLAVINVRGLAGVNIEPVPEPSSLCLAFTIAGLIGFLRHAKSPIR